MVTTGELHPDLRGLDALLRDFVADHDAPGAAVAMVVDRRLVFARGYGYADRATETAVQPTSRFRIASVSKPITAVAVLRLVERGELSLEDKVFAILEVEPHLVDGQAADPRLARVTVRHCLLHAGGWDRDVSCDPMFESPRVCAALGTPPPADRAEIIRYFAGQPLDFDPGERYAYSNFGYCLLGRVIEKLTGQTYEAHAREHVLAPAGIRRMAIGRTPRERRQLDEVTYTSSQAGLTEAIVPGHGDQVPRPYGAWYLEAMDSHGGWIASAVDLARLASALRDGGPLLEPASRELMWARPEGRLGHDEQGAPSATYYALGWRVKPEGDGVTASHNGALDGTATSLCLRHDGVSWAVLFNARLTPRGEHLAGALEPSLHAWADTQPAWPEWDLFESFP